MAANWYALYTMSGNEEKVKAVLEKQMTDFHFVIYRRTLRERKEGKWQLVERKLFPGYILMKGELSDEQRHELKKTDTSFRILENEGECLTLSEQEVRTLALLDSDEDGNVGISQGYMDGDRIVIVSGALCGQEANILSFDHRKGRAKVRLNFCGSERIIELGIDVIEKV